MKKLLIAMAILLLLAPGVSAEAGPKNEPEDLSAASAILIETGSLRVLYEHNANEQRPMASTTKIMTALVASELSRTEDVISVQADCIKIEGTSLYLEENEQLTMLDMLYGLLLRSGNDAAAAIAKYVAGDIDHFVSLMNQRAWQLGMYNTHFENPHGLDNGNHYSTAYDMALLGAEFLKVPLLRQICVADEYISRELTGGRVRLFKNNNKLLLRDPRACGIKIGWTEQAGRCLVAAARVGEMELVAVVLDAPDLYTDVSKLFDYGFGNVKLEELVPQGQVMELVPVSQGRVKKIPVAAAAPVRYPVFAGETVSFTVQVQAPDKLQAPVKAGEPAGTALVQVDGGWTAEVELRTVSPVEEKKGIAARLLDLVRGW
ncbi:MAG: D-alanyl-D-alanine carboxypeptidase family protein [Bacillota bacterium]|jgi:D-alanyl-D-alanine carboxypeptidase (penicillin-binding protein 5/6)|nr:D-alanyl-D-alanine carboxypeptidase [Bacillota bacterium]HOC06364.1 D-alanyl-D-alanine carboxypeptidase family protein [Bacillota bacterium]HPZ21779.1 D-alanyl-D-alanine carboxypeptidase family protein [Bacillota bacterium]HQD19175.1 D-alanyl-D-alanine carboxypeptidase family protein [Bacillota bacterium]